MLAAFSCKANQDVNVFAATILERMEGGCVLLYHGDRQMDKQVDSSLDSLYPSLQKRLLRFLARQSELCFRTFCTYFAAPSGYLDGINQCEIPLPALCTWMRTE